MTAPDVPGRLRAIRERGGKIVVIDPRRSRTASERASTTSSGPGPDALFLFGIVHTLFAEELVRLGRLAEHVAGVEEVDARWRATSRPRSWRRAAASTPTSSAAWRASSPRPSAPRSTARIGTCTQEFGTLGELARRRGQRPHRPPRPARRRDVHPAGRRRAAHARRAGTRQGRPLRPPPQPRAQAPEVFGELPVACLAEEIETPGDGQVRALITIAGNPVLSTPNGARLDARARHRSSSW